MENALQVQRGAAHPGGSLAGEPQMNSWRTEELMILAVRRMFQPWRRATQPRPLAGLELTDRSAARFVSIGSSNACKDCSQLGTVHLRIVGNCVGVAACVPPANYVNNRRCTGFERLRTQRSHSRSGRGMRCNTTWRAALAAQRHIPLMALPRRGRTGLRPIPLLQSIRWIHWFESRPPEMARTTVRLLRPTR